MRPSEAKQEMLTSGQANRLLRYDPHTGKLFNRITRNGAAQAGAEIGWCGTNGYLSVGINYRVYLVHRLIWLMHYGHWPADQIDHIDHNPANNRIANLREATSQENSRNASFYCTNTSGMTGVYWNKRKNKWQVRIGVNRKLIQLGYFHDFQAACTARREAERQYGFHSNHGAQP